MRRHVLVITVVLVACFASLGGTWVLPGKGQHGGGVPIAFVQDDGAAFDPFNSARSVTFTSSTTGGSAIVAIYQGDNATSLVVTDNKSNSYSTVVDGASSTISVAIAHNITGGASHQVTFTVTSHSNPARIIIMEYSGIATASAYDVSAQLAPTFGANSSVVTGATSQANELVLGTIFTTPSVTAGSGFTLRHTEGDLKTEEKIVASAGAQTIGFTHAEASARITGVTFKGQ